MLRHLIRLWRDDSAAPAIEAGFLFPVMVSILCGTVDIGTAVVTNMKVTIASQTVSDLVSRQTTVTDAEINDARMAGQLALQPYSTESYGTDIVGIQYIGVSLTPTVQWRVTNNMEPNADVLARSAGLGLQNEGVIAVTVRFVYAPFFSEFFVGDFVMEEESYVRGRKGGFVAKI